MCPSNKSLAREREKLREMTFNRYCFKPVPVIIQEINQHLKGWSNYFSYGYPRMAYRQINAFIRDRLYTHLKRRSQRPFRLPEGITMYRYLKQLGLVYL